MEANIPEVLKEKLEPWTGAADNADAFVRLLVNLVSTASCSLPAKDELHTTADSILAAAAAVGEERLARPLGRGAGRIALSLAAEAVDVLRALLGSHHWATVTKGALNDAIAGVVVALADPKRGSQQERCQVFGRAVGHDSPLREGARVSVQNGGSQSTSHGTLGKLVQGMSTAKVASGGFAGTLKDVPVADVTVVDAVRPKGRWL